MIVQKKKIKKWEIDLQIYLEIRTMWLTLIGQYIHFNQISYMKKMHYIIAKQNFCNQSM